MARGGQRSYGNAGRSAYSGGTRGAQSRAVFKAGGGGAATPKTRIVTAGGSVPNAVLNSITALSRVPVVLGADVLSDLRFRFDNTFNQNGPVTTGLAPVTIDKVAVEMGGVTYPLTFGGSRSVTLQPGQVIYSDALQPALLSSAKFAKDSLYWMRCAAHANDGATAGGFAVGTRGLVLAGSRIEFGGAYASNANNIDGTGALPANGGTTNTQAFTYTCAIGKVAAGTLSVVAIGDSIQDAIYDSGAQGSIPIVGRGPIARASIGVATAPANSIAYVQFGHSGDTCWATTQAKFGPFGDLLQYASVLWDEFGTNDINGSGTAAAALTSKQALWSVFKAASVGGKILATGLLPRTTGTYSATEADQTPAAGWEQGGKADTLEASLQAAVGSQIDAYLDWRTAVYWSAADRYRWAYASPGLVNPAAETTYTHPYQQQANAPLGAVVRTALLGMGGLA